MTRMTRLHGTRLHRHRPSRPARSSRSARRALEVRRRRRRQLLGLERCESRTMFSLTPAFVADINQTPLGGNPGEVVVAGDFGYFKASDPTHGEELWRTDGTAGGTALVADLAPGSYSSNIANLIDASGQVFFTANSAGTYGNSIWTVDPATGDAIELATDVSTPYYGGSGVFGILGDEVYFWRQSYGPSAGARELWKTDGTTAGTGQVRSFTGYFGFNDQPRFSPATGGRLYFAIDDQISDVGLELWSTDGTTGGTLLAKDIFEGSNSSFPEFLASDGTTLLFRASNWAVTGNELWRTDPTEGAVLVADIAPSFSDSNPADVIIAGETLFLTVSSFGPRTVARIDDFRGASPQATVFTEAVTGALALAGDHVYFAADDGIHGVELWRAATTGGDPELVRDIYDPSALPPFVVDPAIPAITQETEPNNSILEANDLRGSFTEVSSGVHQASISGETGTQSSDWFRVFLPAGYQLSIYGSVPLNSYVLFYDASGEFITYDFLPTAGFTAEQAGDYYVAFDGGMGGYGITFVVTRSTGNAYPGAFTVVGDTLYFTATDAEHGTEVWRTDAVAGAVLVGDLNPGLGSSNPRALTPVGNELFLRANGGELWRASGPGGATKVADGLDEPASGSGSYGAMAVLDGTLLFAADDGTSGGELWAVDSATGATEVLEIAEGNEDSMYGSMSFSSRAVLDGVLYFVADGGDGQGLELWRSDGTEGGTSLVADIAPGFGGGNYGGTEANSSMPMDLTVVGDVVFFSAWSDAGRELWKTDGTTPGTQLVADIRPSPYLIQGFSDSNPQDLTPLGNMLFFSADDGGGRRLWKTDGTTTQKVAGLDLEPGNIVAFDGDIYFTATDPTVGNELHRLDVETGSVEVFDLTPGTYSSGFYDLVVAGGTLFIMDTSGFPLSLKRFVPAAGGVPAGLETLRAFEGGIAPFDRVYGKSAVKDGVLYFVANDYTNGMELWRSDGTAAGTVMVKDILPGTGYFNSSDPSGLTVVGDLLYFAANGEFGTGLWQSDGTSEGTIEVVIESPVGGGPMAFAAAGDFRLVAPLGLVGSGFLVAADGGGPEGVELWSLSTSSSATPSIGTTGSLAALSMLIGDPSTISTVAVTGSNLTGPIVATAPAGFEVSSDGTTFGPTATFTQLGGSASGTLSVRHAAAALVGTYSGTISLESTGATAANVSIPSSTVTDELIFDVASSQTVTHSVNRSAAVKYIKRGLGTLVLDAASGHTGQTTVEAGTLVVAASNALASSAVRVVTGGTLTVNAGVTMRSPSVTVAGGTLAAAGATLLVNATTGIGTFAITSGSVTGSPTVTVGGSGLMTLPTDRRLTVALTALDVDQATGGRIDIGKGRIDIAVGGTTEAALRADVVAGRNTGLFNGTSGIMTTGGAAGNATSPVVGYRVLGTGAAVVAWAAFGDMNLDGQVNQQDIGLISSGGRFNKGAPATWSQGDMNYNNAVNQADISLVTGAARFNKGSYLPVAPTSAGETPADASAGQPAISQDAWIALALDVESQQNKKR